MAAATGCGDKERSCKDVLAHVQRTLTGTPSAYLNTYIGEGDCARRVCNALGIPEVFSPGPDKKPGTEDDIGAGWVDRQLRPALDPAER